MTVLTLLEEPPERLDLSGITPAALAGMSEAEIARLPVGTTRYRLTLGDCFGIAVGEPGRVLVRGGSSRLDRVGAKLAAGTMVVEGDVGQRLGEGMTDGSLEVHGSAGPFAGTGAAGGRISIDGDAGPSAGGTLHGAKAGLNGATLIIKGRAGDRLGDTMRSGLILVGAAGDHAGCRAVAGTIVAGAVGAYPGYGMRRGTLLARECGQLLPTFVHTGRQPLVITRILRRLLEQFAPDMGEVLSGPLDRWAGDLATLGKGEILMPTG
ncbi:formylmethanofuran dehydrogenase subunit C [Enterovirga sp. CN4-39]|uniref:formylmethanofuran dehydrogenase subunit C n=1 Tax=Enterovirga sp. CN4-39 TaxID=3400910 RepID=UPI003BFEBB5C